MTQSICLTRKKLKYKSEEKASEVQCITQAKSEQCIVLTSAKVQAFQTSLKLVREEARAKLSHKENNHATSQESKCLHVGRHYK